MVARALGHVDIYDFFFTFFFLHNKVLLNEKETKSVPAFTMCLKQDKSNAGLAVASTRTCAVRWCSVCSGEGRVTHAHHAVLREDMGGPAVLSGIYCTRPCGPPRPKVKAGLCLG